jgi:hypothetical protein
MRIICLLVASGLAPHLFSQTIVIDWGAKKMNSSPTKINQKTSVTIQIVHANDVHYTY